MTITLSFIGTRIYYTPKPTVFQEKCVRAGDHNRLPLMEIKNEGQYKNSPLFYVGVTMIITCDTKEELESVTESIIAIGKQNSVKIDTHNLMQREARATALPIGNSTRQTLP